MNRTTLITKLLTVNIVINHHAKTSTDTRIMNSNFKWSIINESVLEVNIYWIMETKQEIEMIGQGIMSIIFSENEEPS